MAFSKKDKTESPATKEGKYKAFLAKQLCTFQTAGRRCQMLGGHVDHGSESRLCDWHWLYQSIPNLLQDYDEFVRYRDKERKTYAREWQHSILFVDDALVWACILGKEQRREFVRANRAIEAECDEKTFGNDRGQGKASDNPPSPAVSVEEYKKHLPF